MQSGTTALGAVGRTLNYVSVLVTSPRSSAMPHIDTIHAQAVLGNLAEVHRYLTADPDQITQIVNTPDKMTGKTPLHYAAEYGQIVVVAYLLLNGADPSIKDNEGQTALALANRHNPKGKSASTLHYILKFSLHKAAKDGDLGAIDRFSASLKGLFSTPATSAFEEPIAVGYRNNILNKADAQGNTPLHIAAAAGHTAIFKHLLAEGADPNIANRHGVTALMMIMCTRDADDDLFFALVNAEQNRLRARSHMYEVLSVFLTQQRAAVPGDAIYDFDEAPPPVIG